MIPVTDLRMGDLFTFAFDGPVHRVRNVDSAFGQTYLGLVDEPSTVVHSDQRVYLIEH